MARSLFVRKTIAGVLAAGLFLLIAGTTGLSVAHDLHHAGHHTAGMHSTGVCAWMCAASQGIQAAVLWAPADSEPAILGAGLSDRPGTSLTRRVHPTRGPPTFLL